MNPTDNKAHSVYDAHLVQTVGSQYQQLDDDDYAALENAYRNVNLDTISTADDPPQTSNPRQSRQPMIHPKPILKRNGSPHLGEPQDPAFFRSALSRSLEPATFLHFVVICDSSLHTARAF